MAKSNRRGIIKPNLPEIEELQIWCEIIRKSGITNKQVPVGVIIDLIRKRQEANDTPTS